VADQTEKKLVELGIDNQVGVGFLFQELQRRFLVDLGRSSERKDFSAVRREWSGPNAAIRARIVENWIEPTAGHLRDLLRKHLETFVEFANVRLSTAQTLAQLGATTPEAVSQQFENLRIAFDNEIKGAADEVDRGITKLAWTSRKSGVITLIGDHWLKPAPPELKKSIGAELNKLKAHVETGLEEKQEQLEIHQDERPAEAAFDLSLPGVIRPIGTHHLIRQVFQEIEDIFFSIGFSVVEGPEIETPYYNFEALNIPEHHPVRDDMDTFYLDLPKGVPGPLLLRTHTSPVQIRTMEKRQPPVRVIVPGKVYRRDNPDATHSFMFHQIEGLAVDSDITFCDFTGTIDYFVKQFFGESVKTRFRPSYFPFTEPSVEFDASCIFCAGTGTAKTGGVCGKCKGSGWIELFGAGMVDPAVYGFVNYDPKKVTGFAFGIGIDRLAMLKYGIDDIQVFFQNDVRFLRQFP
jgi:phenylalanyl-tRNA synthetase alpha chain